MQIPRLGQESIRPVLARDDNLGKSRNVLVVSQGQSYAALNNSITKTAKCAGVYLRKAIDFVFMRSFLIVLFGFIFVFMVVMTFRTQMKVSFWNFPAWQPDYAANPWAVATLYDAYFGFTTFFVWVCFKERLLAMKIIWFVLIMALGNIAMSFYVLLQLFKLKADEPVSNVLTRRAGA